MAPIDSKPELSANVASSRLVDLLAVINRPGHVGWRKIYFIYLLIAACLFAINFSYGFFLYVAAAFTVSGISKPGLRKFHLALNAAPAVLALLGWTPVLSMLSAMGLPVGLLYSGLVVPWGTMIPISLIPTSLVPLFRWVYWLLWIVGVAVSLLWCFLIASDHAEESDNPLA